MLTLFATPKPFRGSIATLQRNAITSWARLRPQPEIILFGNDEGTAEIAAELDLRHVPDIACNERGTPLLNAMFETAQAIGRGPWFCFINADIVLMSDFVAALQSISLESFMLSGQRCNTDVTEAIDFTDHNWETQLRTLAASGQLEGPQAMDYFVFPRHLYCNLPEFAVGRPGYDNWLLYQALHQNVPVIDVTDAVLAVHQNHDYNHHPQGKQGVYTGSEAQANLKLIGSRNYAFFMLDLASWRLTSNGMQPGIWNAGSLYRGLEMLPLVRPGTRECAAVLKQLLDRQFGLDSSLDDRQRSELYQRFGELLFSKSGDLFWLSLYSQAQSDALLPTPAQRELTEQLAFQLQQAQAQLAANQQTIATLQAQTEHLSSTVSGMESSKFWQLRNGWFALKRWMHLA